jgi:Zn finger protein HypA/HybF involved in hydrogenase expression
MKIIKEGKIPAPEKFEGACTNCKTSIECAEGETKWEQGDRPWELGVRSARCPLCGHSIYVHEKKEPQ